MILVSACLLGTNCKYNGKNNLNENIVKLIENQHIIPVCPEQLGGLETPRVPCEINGNSEGVFYNNAMVINKDGQNKTKEFLNGAYETLKIAKLFKIQYAILKENSPSCGVQYVYDGTFSGKKKNGSGVTTTILQKHGIIVYSEENYCTKGGIKDEEKNNIRGVHSNAYK